MKLAGILKEDGRNISVKLKKIDSENCIFVHACKKSHRVYWSESRVVKIMPNYFHKKLTQALRLRELWCDVKENR